MQSMSHPARGAWIEIVSADIHSESDSGRTPQGVRGLKLKLPMSLSQKLPVAPRKGCVD